MDDIQFNTVRAAKQGDKQAFSELVRAYKHFVYRLAVGILRDPVEAEDVAQEAFVKAFLALRTLKDERAFPAWISTITTRLAADVLKKRKAAALPVDTVPEPLLNVHAATAAENRLTIFELMSTLSPEHRAVMVLREIQGFDYQEIADILDIPIGTVKSRLHNARTMLRNAMFQDSDKTHP